MIVLDTPTRKLQIVLAGAKTTLDAIFLVAYEDAPIGPQQGGQQTAVPGTLVGNTNGTTAVDLVTAPPAGYVRRVLSIQLNNADTGSITPSFTFIDSVGTVSKVLFKVTRATLEQLTYENGAGFQCFSVAGARQ